LLVVALGDSATIAFKFAFNNDDNLAEQWVFDQSVLRCDCLTLYALHELCAQDNHVATVFDKNTVTQRIVFAPQKQVVLVAMLDWPNSPFVWSLEHFDHLVQPKSVTLGITSTESSTTCWGRQFLAKVGNLHVFNLTLLIDELNVIFVDLQHKTCILVTIVLDQIHSGDAVFHTVQTKQC
jgi:hypothetical protein